MKDDEAALVWTPSARATGNAAITEFARFVCARGGPLADSSYEELWRWSVEDTTGFWSAVAEFCELAWDTPPDAVTDGEPMPGTRWFPGGRLNYAAQVFRTRRIGPAVVGHDEIGISRTLTWAELEEQVAGLAATLDMLGVRAGDRVARYLSDCPEALVAGIEEPDGGYWMPMFVTLAGGRRLDEDLTTAIRAAMRDQVSPQHVPDEVIQAPGIPHTRTGKKLEVPVKNILQGFTGAVQKDAVDRAELLEFYREAGACRRRMQDQEGTSP